MLEDYDIWWFEEPVFPDNVPASAAAARRAWDAAVAEALGFESVWVFDHFHTVPEATQEATHECWTLMAALANVTERVRLGQMCTCALYRPPALLAKMASTIDVLSRRVPI